MNIIIVGGGKVGLTLARQLCDEGNNITLLDTDPNVIEKAVNSLDIKGVVGSGTSYKAQMEAGITDADVLIAVTGNDETSLLSCLIAKKAGNCKTIAKVRDPEFYSEIRFLREELGLALAINPDIAAAMEIERLIQIPSALEVDTFAKGRVTIIRVQIPKGSVLDGLSISNLHQKVSENILVCIAERGEEIIIPNGSTTLCAGDFISVIMPLHEITSTLQKIGIKTKPIKSIMIAGGGKIAYYLAQRLLRAKQQVKIIERNPKRCEQLSTLLPKAMILCGDASDEELLQEEGIANVDAFISLTDFDESNILMSLYAHDVANPKIITKISRISFEKILESIPVGTTIFPKYITAEHIIRYVRAMSNSVSENDILALYKMIGGKAEALEFYVDKSALSQGIANVPLMNLNIRKDVIIGCINKKGKLVTPNGSDTMDIGDTVIVVTTATNKLSGLSDIVEKGK